MKLTFCSLSKQIKIARIQYHVYQSSHGDKNILKHLRSLRVNLTLKQKSKHVTLMNSTNVENLWKNEEMFEPKQKEHHHKDTLELEKTPRTQRYSRRKS